MTNLAQQIFVIKTDGPGNLLWSKSFGFVSFDHVTDVMQSADGNYVLAGIISGQLAFSNWILRHFNLG
ncbi:MAG: hypothetical protein IPH33_07200 [Bacteroidetes bacterium]|nr:hypothetical protein [Bacteroidota bacterium]